MENNNNSDGFKFSKVLKSNPLGILNLLVMLCGFAYYSGGINQTLLNQQKTINSIEVQIATLPGLVSTTAQNTTEISSLQSERVQLSGQLVRISNQIASLKQWVSDHNITLGK